MIESFLLGVFAHCVGDYPLQGDYLATMKRTSILHLIIHSIIWAGCVYIALKFSGLNIGPLCFLFLSITHALIDSLALTSRGENWFYADQSLHILQVIIAVLC